VDPEAAAALHEVAGLGMRLLLAAEVTPAEVGRAALDLAGVGELSLRGSCRRHWG
jgi:hypothetical protein